MKNRLLMVATGLLLSAVLAGCSTAAQSGTQAAYVDMEEAKAAALGAAQVETADATFTKVELERDDGAVYYEVDFTDAAGQRYEYAVDALTGTVIAGTGGTGTQTAAQGNTAAQGSGTTAQGGTAAANGQIGEDEAKRIALEDAGITEITSDELNEIGNRGESVEGYTISVSVQFAYDVGVPVYDVEFTDIPGTNGTVTEYDYEIDAATGAIRSMDHDAERVSYTAGTIYSGSANCKTEAEIRAIALAKVPGATDSDISLHLDEDDGRLQYEGRIIYQNMKYEFEIDAYSGAIRDWDAESVFDD